MSGIAGIFLRDGGPIDPSQLHSMAAALTHRGPDGISIATKGHIGLIHCMLHDTPESLLERLPASSPEGSHLITWQGRIDNRKELCDKTGWSAPLKRSTDSQLVLAAYRKWGTACVHELLGDFSFAIWDNTAQRLFCARDHMGIKPFYYRINDHVFCFASEIKGLTALSDCPGTLNSERIADYLSCVVTETHSTFYKDIKRLPPGHTLVVNSKASTLNKYWEPHPSPLVYRNHSEYEEHFYDIFAKAVRCRLRACHPIGSLLSGGLDSASIVSMAAGPLKEVLPGHLATFSGIFDKIRSCDERSFFQDILTRYPLRPHMIHADIINPGLCYERLIATEDEPFWAPHFFMIESLMALARRQGIRILLDGHDGDSALSHGSGRLPELLLQGKWLRLARECHAMGNFSLKKGSRLLLGVCKDSLSWHLASRLPRTLRKQQANSEIGNLNPLFAAQSGIKERLTKAESLRPRRGQPEALRHKLTITQVMHPIMLEFLERQGMQNGLVPRFPFFDKRLIEFCLALPSELKFNNGYTRFILRQSLRKIVPSAVYGRRTKTNFAPNLRHAYSGPGKEWFSFEVDNLYCPAYTYINKDRFLTSSRLFLRDPARIGLRDLGYLLRNISFARWLHQRDEENK